MYEYFSAVFVHQFGKRLLVAFDDAGQQFRVIVCSIFGITIDDELLSGKVRKSWDKANTSAKHLIIRQDGYPYSINS